MPEVNFNELDMEMSESDLARFAPDCDEWEDDEWEDDYEL